MFNHIIVFLHLVTVFFIGHNPGVVISKGNINCVNRLLFRRFGLF